MRHVAPALLLLLPALLGCQSADMPAAPGPSAQEIAEIRSRAPQISRVVRVSVTCNLPISPTGQDRAERIELAALDILRREGGQAASESFLRDVQSPRFDARRRDRSRWCRSERQELRRTDDMLSGPEGAALAERADGIRAAYGR